MTSKADGSDLTLGQRQELFGRLKAAWWLWVVEQPGWALRPGEGRILQTGAKGLGRRARVMGTGSPMGLAGRLVLVRDEVHDVDSLHYLGLAEDPQLFVDGVHITASDHSVWLVIGAKWESMHPLCAWGGRFDDGNHISVRYRGKA